jgi:lipopolysaccharide/colanic/teichoic acid biosynthesis glycosyltransferase
MAVVWVLVRTRMGRPAIFRQQRAGRLGRPFLILKFRSMSQACDAQGRLLPDLQRLQPLGRFLRNSSLDELPQLWNVLRGDMSLVGPRPLLLEYVPRYSPEQRHRLDVRPGITGLAQVSGRNSLEWEDRMRLDLEYVGRLSLGLDLRILFRTVKRVLTAADVPADGVDPVQPPWTRAGPQATTDATGTEAAAIPSVSRDSRGAA